MIFFGSHATYLFVKKAVNANNQLGAYANFLNLTLFMMLQISDDKATEGGIIELF